jgi:uncharacterized iron-regulated membrane protein
MMAVPPVTREVLGLTSKYLAVVSQIIGVLVFLRFIARFIGSLASKAKRGKLWRRPHAIVKEFFLEVLTAVILTTLAVATVWLINVTVAWMTRH